METIELFTLEALRTPAGLALAVWLLTQVVKDIPGIKAIPTQFVTLVLAWAIMTAVAALDGTLSLATGLLILVNGPVISLGTNAVHDRLLVANGYAKPPMRG